MSEVEQLAVRRAIGKKIRYASYLLYYFNGTPNAVGVGGVEIAFESGEVLSLFGLGDGESVSAAEEALEVTPEFSLDGGICSWSKESLQDLLDAPWIVGAKIASAKAAIIQKTGQAPHCIGWQLELEDGHTFCFINDCDEERALIGGFPDYFTALYPLVLLELAPHNHSLQARRP